jgi:predicted transcriptional regulator
MPPSKEVEVKRFTLALLEGEEEGLTTPQIAERLKISRATAYKY